MNQIAMVDLKEYIEHPELLDGLDMEELSDEMQKYPASTRIRWLWMMKKQREAGEPLNDLRLAWMHAPEMTSFYEAFRSNDSDDYFIESDAKESEDIKQDDRNTIPEAQEEPESTQAHPPTDESQQQAMDREQAENEEEESKPLESFKPSTSPGTSETGLDEQAPQSDFLRWLLEKSQGRRTDAGEERETDSETVAQDSAEQEVKTGEESKEKTDPRTEEEKEALQAAIKKSIEEDEDILSPTLAKVLGEQGHTQRAIEMYEKLRLVYPEKSSYFADQIDRLKNQ